MRRIPWNLIDMLKIQVSFQISFVHLFIASQKGLFVELAASAPSIIFSKVKGNNNKEKS